MLAGCAIWRRILWNCVAHTSWFSCVSNVMSVIVESDTYESLKSRIHYNTKVWVLGSSRFVNDLRFILWFWWCSLSRSIKLLFQTLSHYIGSKLRHFEESLSVKRETVNRNDLWKLSRALHFCFVPQLSLFQIVASQAYSNISFDCTVLFGYFITQLFYNTYAIHNVLKLLRWTRNLFDKNIGWMVESNFYSILQSSSF